MEERFQMVRNENYILKKKNKRLRIILVLTWIVLCICAGYFIGNLMSNKSKSFSEQAKNKMNLIESIIDDKYLGDVNNEDVKNGIYKGMVSGLGDKYTEYYSKEEYSKLMESVTGYFGGIGVTAANEDGNVLIRDVMKGSVSYREGVKAGDIVIGVEGEDVKGKDVDYVVDKIRGEIGTKVKIKVYRPQTKKEIDFTLTREQISDITVFSSALKDYEDIGYIRIYSFASDTYNQLTQAIDNFKKDKVKGLIFDVRNNPGGELVSVCNILDYILPEGTVVYTQDKNGEKTTVSSDESSLDIPYVVLVNENSASASEIFAGAIQDYEAGEIIGTTTFGKGVVQQIIELNEGDAIKVTIENYYTPLGRNINKTGIKPDVEVKLDAEAKEDTQFNKAVDIILDKTGIEKKK